MARYGTILGNPSSSALGASSEEMAHGTCARCLAAVGGELPECPGCATPFTGAGSFDLVRGPAPSREFAFLFTPGTGSHHRAFPGRVS